MFIVIIYAVDCIILEQIQSMNMYKKHKLQDLTFGTWMKRCHLEHTQEEEYSQRQIYVNSSVLTSIIALMGSTLLNVAGVLLPLLNSLLYPTQ